MVSLIIHLLEIWPCGGRIPRRLLENSGLTKGRHCQGSSRERQGSEVRGTAALSNGISRFVVHLSKPRVLLTAYSIFRPHTSVAPRFARRRLSGGFVLRPVLS